MSPGDEPRTTLLHGDVAKATQPQGLRTIPTHVYSYDMYLYYVYQSLRDTTVSLGTGNGRTAPCDHAVGCKCLLKSRRRCWERCAPVGAAQARKVVLVQEAVPIDGLYRTSAHRVCIARTSSYARICKVRSSCVHLFSRGIGGHQITWHVHPHPVWGFILLVEGDWGRGAPWRQPYSKSLSVVIARWPHTGWARRSLARPIHKYA